MPLAGLEVSKSHSRRRISKGNPCSESWFETLKFAPVSAQRSGSLADAEAFISYVVDGHTHRHTGIGLNTPADVGC